MQKQDILIFKEDILKTIRDFKEMLVKDYSIIRKYIIKNWIK